MTISPVRTAPVRTAARQQPAPPPEEDTRGIGDCVEKLARKVAGIAVGLVFGTSGLVTNAAAGAAAGAVHGARVNSKTAFYGVMTANLAAAGAVGGPAGIATSLAGGYLLWGVQGKETRGKVEACAHEWTDKVLAKLPGDPNTAGLPRRLANGVVGEVVGAAGGVVAGTLGLYQAGEAVGGRFVDRVADRLRRD